MPSHNQRRLVFLVLIVFPYLAIGFETFGHGIDIAFACFTNLSFEFGFVFPDVFSFVSITLTIS